MATSNPTRPGTPSHLVQVHAYRQFAPVYAVAPAGAGSPSPPPPPPSAFASPKATPHSAVRPFTAHEVRQLVLEYLAHEGYVDSAVAFAREMVLDDGDRRESAASGEDSADAAPPRRRADPEVGERADATGSDEMQDVEGPAEVSPSADARAATAAAAEEEEEETESVRLNGVDGGDTSAVNGTGKTVAFVDGDEEADGAVPSALSEDQVLDLRLRKSESRWVQA